MPSSATGSCPPHPRIVALCQPVLEHYVYMVSRGIGGVAVPVAARPSPATRWSLPRDVMGAGQLVSDRIPPPSPQMGNQNGNRWLVGTVWIAVGARGEAAARSRRQAAAGRRRQATAGCCGQSAARGSRQATAGSGRRSATRCSRHATARCRRQSAAGSGVPVSRPSVLRHDRIMRRRTDKSGRSQAGGIGAYENVARFALVRRPFAVRRCWRSGRLAVDPIARGSHDGRPPCARLGSEDGRQRMTRGRTRSACHTATARYVTQAVAASCNFRFQERGSAPAI